MYRLYATLTQAEVAARAGCPTLDQPRLSLIERGLPPSLEEAQALARVFDCPVSDLLPEMGDA
jgi:transcriptional regulator with XRE-family HTH domain